MESSPSLLEAAVPLGRRKRPRPSSDKDETTNKLPFAIEWPTPVHDDEGEQAEPSRVHAVVTFFAPSQNKSSHGEEPQQPQPQNGGLCIMGRAQLKCLQGAIDILGYRLDSSHDEPIPLESPPWSSLLVLHPLFSTAENIVVQVDSWWPPSAATDAEDHHNEEATFELVPSMAPRVRPTCIPPTWEHAMEIALPTVRQLVLQNHQKDDEYDKLRRDTPSIVQSGAVNQKESSSLESTTTSSSKGFCMAICGAKGVGKSTFLRYATNRILSDNHQEDTPTSTTAHDTTTRTKELRLKRVAILDADVGQPEMSPPGIVTLTIISQPLLTPPHYRSMALSSAFPCCQEQQWSHFFGSVTSRNDPNRYMQLIQNLMRQYYEYQQQDNQNNSIPLLINLDGWVKGLGYELLTTLLTEVLNPTHVIQIVGNTKSKQFQLRQVLNPETSRAHLEVIYAYNSALNVVSPAAAEAPPQTTIHVENSSHNGDTVQATEETKSTNNDSGETNNNDKNGCETSTTHVAPPPPPAKTAAFHKVPVSCTMPAHALRALRLCTYFLNDVTIWYNLGFGREGIGDDTCEIAHRLAAALPYAVPFEAVEIQWEGSDHFADLCRSNFDLTLDAINAKLVGLCCRPSTTSSNNSKYKDDESSSDNNSNGCEDPLHCVGLGLVRSIDRAKGIFYILTPVESERLKEVNVLVGGTVDVPIEFWFRGIHAEAFPYQTYAPSGGGALLGTEPMNSRNNIARKSLMRS